MPLDWTERPVVLGSDRSLVGVVTRPGEPDAEAPAVVVPNAGLLHRVGPNRMHVELARRLASRGHTVLRFDLHGFGDSGPRRERLSFRAGAVADVREAMDLLEASFGIERFVTFGLCSGADLSLEVASVDARVEAALLVDSFAYGTLLYRLGRYRRWLANSKGRRRLVESLGNFARRARAALARDSIEEGRLQTLVEPAWQMPPGREVLRQVHAALARRVSLVFVYSGSEAWANYLTHFFLPWYRLRRAGRIEVHRFPEADHTFTLASERRKLLELTESWMARRKNALTRPSGCEVPQVPMKVTPI